MALRILPFGAFEGFADLAVPGTHYYSQGFSPSHFGAATLYSLANKRDSTQVMGMGNIKYFASANGTMYAQDDNGNILKETTPGAYDFGIVRSPGGNGAGLLGDQYKNLLYAQNTTLGKYDGSTWNDSYQTLAAGQHPMDTYEDLRLIANVNGVAVLYSDGTFNSAAFSLPSAMTVTCLRSGPTGILIGANLGYQGTIILWDGNSLRSKTPWKWFNGQIIAIDRYGANWIVKTTRGAFLTNGYTVKKLFGVIDDQLSFNSYDSTYGYPQNICVVDDLLIMLVNTSNPTARLKPGLYLYHLRTGSFNFFPIATGNTIQALMYSVFVDVNYNNRILVGYTDTKLGKSYIGAFSMTPPTSAVYVSEAIGIGRPHYQRSFFGPTDKTAEAVVLNLQPLHSLIDPATLTFTVSLKIYNFKRELWGKALTNASLSNKATLQIDGTASTNYDAQVGDEVTILSGINAGQVAHITSIANDAASNETWTLDTTLTGQTENNAYVQVQPFILVKKQTFTNLVSLKNIFWSVNSIKGKQFLAKFVFEGLGTNLALELMTSYFVFDDIGYDQT